jgi:chromosome segregation ATPase
MEPADINRLRSKSIQKERHAIVNIDNTFDAKQQNASIQSGKQRIIKPNNNQSEALSSAMKALQDKIKETTVENVSLRERLKSGIDEMKKFENRFKFEKEKWQKHLLDELKHSSQNEASMKESYDKLAAEKKKAVEQLDIEKSKLLATKKEFALLNEKILKSHFIIEELQKKCDSYEKKSYTAESQYSSLEGSKKDLENQIQTLSDSLNQEQSKNSSIIAEIEKLQQECVSV